MPIVNSYNVAPSLNALNTYDARASLDVSDEIGLNIVVGDFSRSFAAESIESRVIVFHRHLAVAGRVGILEFAPRTKPFVIEYVRVSGIAANALFFISDVLDARPVAATMAGASYANIGGITAEGRINFGFFVSAGFGGIQVAAPSPGVWTSPENVRIYIPPGKKWWVYSKTSSALDIEAVVRELPDLPHRRG